MKLFPQKQKRKKTVKQITPRPEDAVKWLLAEHVKPYLKQAGFAKYGMNFFRNRGDIIDVINFQASKWNGFGNHSFYINCGMDSLIFQLESSGDQNPKPVANACLYADRIESFVGGANTYVVAENYKLADLEKCGQCIVAQLQNLLEYFSKVTSVGDLIDLAIQRNGLQYYEKICYYLAQENSKVRLTRYIRGLHTRFSKTDDRWPIIAHDIHAFIGKHADDKVIAELLEGHQTPT